MNFYEQNIENIKKYKIQVYEELMKYDSLLAEKLSEEVYSVDTKDDIQALIIKKNDTEFRMNSTFHPIKEAERWVKQYTFFHLNNVIVMFGLGNGLFANHIMRNMNDNDHLIIYEPSAKVFFHALQHYNLKELIKNNNVVLSIQDINEHAYHVFLQRHVNITNVKTRLVCTHPAYDKIFPNHAIDFWNELKDNYIHVKGNINTEAYFGKTFIENTLENYKYLKNSIGLTELGRRLPKDIPFIIVAAGPSVEDNIDELRKAKGKSIIVAVDRVLDFLLDNGVEPDLIATLDPVKPLNYFSVRSNISIPLICMLESNINVLASHKGRKIISNVGKFISKIYKDNNKVPPIFCMGSSVATMVFGTAISLEFKTIILVGQDLAYNGKFTHAGQVAERDGQDLLVDGIDGNKVSSRVDWHEFIIWYQDLIKFNPSVSVYDTKSSGGKIIGAILKPLREIMMDYGDKNYSISELIETIESEFNEEEFTSIEKYITGCSADLEDVKIKAQDGHELCKNLIKEWERNKCTSANAAIYLKDMGKVTKYISECNVYNLLESYITAFATEDLSNIYTFSESEKDNRINTYNSSKRIFECIEQACDYVMPIIEKKV